MAAGSHIGFDLGNVRPPRSVIAGLSLVVKFGLEYYVHRFIVLEILRFLYFAVWAGCCLVTPIFGEFWGQNLCAETRRLMHKA